MSNVPVVPENWNAKFISKKHIEHDVEGVKSKFYPISAGLTFKLRAFAEPIAKLLAVLFAEKGKDNGTISRNLEKVGIEGADGQGLREFITHPIPADLANVRYQQRTEAISAVMTMFLNDETRIMLSEIIMDSMRDDFPRRQVGVPPAEFAGQVDLIPFIECLIGVAKANSGVFGPLIAAAGIDVSTLAKTAQSAIKDAVGQVSTAG